MCGLLLISLSFSWPYAAFDGAAHLQPRQPHRLARWHHRAALQPRHRPRQTARSPRRQGAHHRRRWSAWSGVISRPCGWSCSSSRASFSSPACAPSPRTSRSSSPPSASASTRPSRRSSPSSSRSPGSASANSAWPTPGSDASSTRRRPYFYWIALHHHRGFRRVLFLEECLHAQRLDGRSAARRPPPRPE